MEYANLRVHFTRYRAKETHSLGGKENKKSPGNTGDYRRLKSEKEGEVKLELHVYAVQRLWQISQGWINGYQLHDSPIWK